MFASRRSTATSAMLALMLVAGHADAGDDKSGQAACFESRAYIQDRIDACTALLARDDTTSEEKSQAYLHRGAAQAEIVLYTKALADFAAAATLSPDSPNPHYARGRIEMERGDHRGAVAAFTGAIERSPPSSRLHHLRGMAHYLGGSLPSARNDLTRAIELGDPLPLTFALRGHVHWQLGRHEAAHRDFDIVLRHDANNVDTYFDRGGLRLEMGRLNGAINDLDMVIRLDPKHAAAFRGRARARWRKGQPAKALADFEDAIALAPTDLEIVNDMAWFLAAVDDDAYRDGATALVLARQAVAIDRKSMTLDTLAAAHAAAGQFEAAARVQISAIASLESEDVTPSRLAAFRARLAGYERREAYRER